MIVKIRGKDKYGLPEIMETELHRISEIRKIRASLEEQVRNIAIVF